MSPSAGSLIAPSIVRLNRWTIVLGVLIAFLVRAPIITTALFLVVAAAACFGRRASLIYRVGSFFLRNRSAGADGEDPRLMRFNNALAAVMLGIAQVAFLLHAGVVGWFFSGLTALAAAVALAGFCLGCFLFYQFKLNQARIFER